MTTTILFQGDSITDCGRARETCDNTFPANLGLGTGYPNTLASRLLYEFPDKDIRCLNRGISGNRIVDLYARWKSDAINLNPDIISILIGVNDTWHDKHEDNPNGVEVDRAEMMYRNLLTWTKQALPKVKLVILEPFVLPCGAVSEEWLEEIDQRRAFTRKLADEFNADAFIPLQQLFNDACKQAPQEYWLRDGVHPSLAGHQLIANAWYDAVKPLL